ncbi:hypothetical protein DKG77_13100 [Flagellimonas aquimarina]|uniref:Glycosyltransferase n=1 Tax=Flagellimonas aquimarina TaxID=2201895 RepID=A0A316L1C9_9FLAO|nr:hypothetical protein [Allomuricauda koreensis]PWL39148.1 hypothetical protein DKG77_13100 [Allomuricauda koreensis]
MKNTLIVLAQSLEQPRIVKRINQKAKEYKDIHVYGFTRNVHSVDNHEVLGKNKNVNISIAGQLENGKYLKRIFTYLKLLVKLYKRHGLRKKSVYVFGLDLRIFSFFLFNAQVDYEISDIVWLYDGNLKRKVLSFTDRLLAGKSRKVVFTTKSFYSGYYSKSVKEDRVIVAENKLETYDRVLPIEQIKNDKVRIAYVGAFRYPRIIENLLTIVSENSNLVLNFYGATHGRLIEKINQATESNSNIFYHGSFKNPDDLEKIYRENNLNFVVYNNLLENERVAMPNKFYESGFFNVPIVCATRTYVGERVLNANMGWTIDTDFESISKFLNSISVSELVESHENIKKLNKGQFIT